MNYVYLAGPIAGLTYGDATDWRDDVKRALETMPHVKALSPLRNKTYFDREQTLEDSYEQLLFSGQRAITVRDRFDCLRADVILMNLLGAKKVSIGSMIEMGWADDLKRPVVLVMEPGNIHDHAMVRELASWIVPDLQQAVTVVHGILTHD
tara:strand:+ start:104 stop:556 length:453 start_codon:yes stop_codon:yes gene_type:complete